MSAVWTISVKSTLDKLLNDLALANSMGYYDLDGAYLSPDQAESKDATLISRFLGVSPALRDPLYQGSFQAGVSVGDDPAQYASLKYMSILLDMFRIGAGFDVYDYSGAVRSENRIGLIVVTAVVPSPTEFDQVSSQNLHQFIFSGQRCTLA